ncbi:hypothetical protein FRC10_000976 [Ceratobasidium sp. 414]|nr:hypothetical protein FRC10_000976 [Ceratobasidium sp. 414]
MSYATRTGPKAYSALYGRASKTPDNNKDQRISDLETQLKRLAKAVDRLMARVGALEQPEDQEEEPSDDNNSDDQEPDSNRNHILEFLAEFSDEIDEDERESWETYQNALELLELQYDDDLDYDEEQNSKTGKEAVRDFLRRARDQGTLSKEQYRRLKKHRFHVLIKESVRSIPGPLVHPVPELDPGWLLVYNKGEDLRRTVGARKQKELKGDPTSYSLISKARPA